MRNEPSWVTPDGVIYINADQVSRTSEPHQLLDRGLLESACAKPKNHWAYDSEDDVVVLAASLMLGLAQNHPFLQGNKRTAFVAMIGFLGANGYGLEIADDDHNFEVLIDAVARKISEEEFISALRPRVWPSR